MCTFRKKEMKLMKAQGCEARAGAQTTRKGGSTDGGVMKSGKRSVFLILVIILVALPVIVYVAFPGAAQGYISGLNLNATKRFGR